MMQKPQYAILRFAKYKGPEIGRIEAHDERTKEKSPGRLKSSLNMLLTSSRANRLPKRLFPQWCMWTRKRPTCTFVLSR